MSMNVENTPTELLTVDAVAVRLGVSTKTVRRLIRRHELPAVRIGRGLRVDEHELQEFIYGEAGQGNDDTEVHGAA